jgi:hypothetical protein
MITKPRSSDQAVKVVKSKRDPVHRFGRSEVASVLLGPNAFRCQLGKYELVRLLGH